MSELLIGPGTQVTLHFAVKLDDGSEVDSTFDSNPATFVVGDGNLLEGFEKLLFGLTAGDRNSFEVLPEQGFGAHNPNNIQEIPRSSFEDGMELSEGLMVSFADANNNELPGIVQSFDEQTVTVDFNHPLAGRNLIFDVEVLAVEPAVTH
ncbi:FKBP-type peptidyl-prolyl cis-trans isomerase [Gilvimarinus sp. F26214L]|uniref:FKBP-type peptidyl-prolyl cis-trans isomerase n=1 Tax=Gilvimarinus sp. DZF01 TaxID=3461371 RepID=UPI0040456D0A